MLSRFAVNCVSFPRQIMFAGLFLLGLAGCSSTHTDSNPSNPTAPTVTIAASPATVTAGGSSTLTVGATNATTVKIAGSDGSAYTLAAAGGTQAVTPTANTTYTATATGDGGTVTGTATVTVTPVATPAPTVTISASPATITAGGTSTLTVAATNATAVTITGSDGSSYTLPGAGGTQSVSPQATTIYTANATGNGGSATATATLTVVPAGAPAPTVTISADPPSILAGSTSNLMVVGTNATAVTITGSDGSSYTLPGVGGTQPVNPQATTTYTAKATGGSQTATATITVTVTANPAPALTFTASANSITAGSSSILNVSATNATQVVITGTDNSSYPLAAAGGTQAVSPAVTTTYTATAKGAGGTVSKTLIITVTPNPAPTIQMIADPTSITVGQTSSLKVTTLNADTVTIAGSDGTSYTLAQTSDTQTVTPSTTTTYTATAKGPGGTTMATATVTVTPKPLPTVTLVANPSTVVAGNPVTLNLTVTNATQATITGSDNSSYTVQTPAPDGTGSQIVSPASTTTYTATVTNAAGNATAATTVTVTPAGSLQSIDHVIFLLQENHSFDNYFGMLNPYRDANGFSKGDDGVTYKVDGLDGSKAIIPNLNDEGVSFSPFPLKSTCVDDESSDWLSSYGDVNRYNFSATRPIQMTGFVHTAEGFAKSCVKSGNCSGTFQDTAGMRSMGYYDQNYLNYYYYMASQFALSDRWFSPMASKSVPNRLVTFTGGTSQGLVKDPGGNDHLSQLSINNIFQELDTGKVSWKIYFTVTEGLCLDADDCLASGNSVYPAIHFSNLSYSFKYLYNNPTGAACRPPTVASSAVGDTSNSYCVDATHIAPIGQYFTDVQNGTLPSFAFIEAGYGHNDEHPGSGQSVLNGQGQVASLVNSLMNSPSWKDSVFFMSYDEGGGPYDHVPPVPGHSNDFTDLTTLGQIPDISSIAVNADTYAPCVPTGGSATLHCDLAATDPGAKPTDAPAMQGFSAQLGFRVPNMVISPFTKRHYVSHIPMDHTAVIKFVEDRFIPGDPHLTPHDAAQPNLLDFFDFTNVPWAVPPTPPTPAADPQSGPSSCKPNNFY